MLLYDMVVFNLIFVNIKYLYILLYFTDTVQKKFPSTTPDAINIQITSFLRHSKERLKKN